MRRGREEPRRGVEEERSIDVQMQRRRPHRSWRLVTGDDGGDKKAAEEEESRREASSRRSGLKK
jgi:hypothetical protein